MGRKTRPFSPRGGSSICWQPVRTAAPGYLEKIVGKSLPLPDLIGNLGKKVPAKQRVTCLRMYICMYVYALFMLKESAMEPEGQQDSLGRCREVFLPLFFKGFQSLSSPIQSHSQRGLPHSTFFFFF